MGWPRELLKRNLDGETRLEGWLINAILVIGALVCLIPFYWLFRSALMHRTDHFLTPVPIVPPRPTLQAFRELAHIPLLPRQFLNSFLVVGLSTLNAVVVNTMAAYALARMHFRGQNLVLLLFIGTILIPAQISVVPLYLVVRRLGMDDTYWGMILPFNSSGFMIFLLRQFFLRIPRDLEDAAMLDGANRLQVLWHIILPLSRPAIVVVALTNMIWYWDDYLWPLVVTRTDAIRPAAVAIPKLLGAVYTQQDPSLLAAGLLALTLPVVIVTLFGMNAFVRGLSAGGIKQ
jgi:ABC-type glycerol-3-phosphate transport system permease component